LFARELENYLSANGCAPAFRVVVESGKAQGDDILRRIIEAPPPEVAVIANERDSAPHDGFTRAFSYRFAHGPDYTARYGYESARLLVAAAGKAGLNRTRIRDAVRGLSPWEGVAATIVWDPLGRNLLLPVDSAICTIAGETLTFRKPQ
jgi:hypothetical protein